jgi:hypothetical protein
MCMRLRLIRVTKYTAAECLFFSGLALVSIAEPYTLASGMGARTIRWQAVICVWLYATGAAYWLIIGDKKQCKQGSL